MKPLAAIFVLAAVAVLSSAQQPNSSLHATVPLIDASPKGSPVTLSGTLNSTDDLVSDWTRNSFKVEFQATNVSQKDILLLITNMDLLGNRGLETNYRDIRDGFFGSVIKSHSTITLDHSSIPVLKHQGVTGPTDPKPPKATAWVAFVQFRNGSTWGDPQAAKQQFKERSLVWNEMKLLAKIYQNKGAHAFVAELKKPSKFGNMSYPALLHLQNLYATNGNDAEAVMNELNKMLEYANQHKRTMQSESARK